MEECHDIAIIGSGVSCAYTLIHYIAGLEQHPPEKPVRVVVYEKSGEFWNGVPYGSRSGSHSLLISSLKEFLTDKTEREAFAAWLDKNRDWVFDRFEEGDGKLSAHWLRTNAKAMSGSRWDDLFVPRYTFGLYMQQRLTALLRRAAKNGILECNLVAADVVDIRRVKHLHRIQMVTASGGESSALARKVILGIGSPPNSVLRQSISDCAGKRGCIINDMYAPSMEFNIRRIVESLRQSGGQRRQVLIVGTNASALEAIYCLNNSVELHGLLGKFLILSCNAEFPHRIGREAHLANDLPRHLRHLVKTKARTARQILDAVRLDVALAKSRGINVADLYGDISKAMIEALNQLSLAEQKKFVAKHGVEIGRMQRRAGADYLDVVDALLAEGRIEMLKGKFVRCIPMEGGDLGCEFATGGRQRRKVIAGPVSVVISCAGFQELSSSSSTLIRNLIRRKICTPNASERGFLINENFEVGRGFHVMGPLVAGNLTGKVRVWHAESCSRILAMSKRLAEVLLQHDCVPKQVTET